MSEAAANRTRPDKRAPHRRGAHLACVVTALAWSVPAAAQAPDETSAPEPSSRPPRTSAPAPAIDVDSIQGILAVRRLDGWLLHDVRGGNPIAQALVSPTGSQTRRWFYYVPAQGDPVAVVHRSETSRFSHAPGEVVSYDSRADLERELGAVLEGASTVAMEYAPDTGIPSLTRVDAGTVDLVRSRGVRIRSSADLVQFTVASWGEAGRVAHYVAVHHLVKLRDRALSLVAERLRAGEPVTEHDVQQAILDGYDVRGLSGPPPRVAVGANAANPTYTPTAERTAPIERGDVLVVDAAARVASAERGVYADLTWTAYAGAEVPDRYRELFDVVVRARDAAIALIRERLDTRRAVRGFEVDRAAREVIEAAGHGDAFIHRTGYSLGTGAAGAGANLDDHEVHDTRPLVAGSGFAIGPGVYLEGDVGVRTQVDAHIRGRTLEITGPLQQRITPILP